MTWTATEHHVGIVIPEHVKRHGTNTEVGRSLAKRAAEGNAAKSKVMEASATKSGHRSGATALYTITSEQLCLDRMKVKAKVVCGDTHPCQSMFMATTQHNCPRSGDRPIQCENL